MVCSPVTAPGQSLRLLACVFLTLMTMFLSCFEGWRVFRLPGEPAGRAIVSVPGCKKAHDGQLHEHGIAAARLAIAATRHWRPPHQIVQVSKGDLQDVIEAVQIDLAEQHACMGRRLHDQEVLCLCKGTSAY